ncbi:MAG: 30S ribosome-binding factor RbfA [Candidatus Omnitrophica bacterium]|nr:30S ribosome-binding factor RbfA [Candidatus Omnitrophota bacterium]
MIDRMERIIRLIKNEISVILQEDVNDPDILPLIITRVEITRDMRIAKVFCDLGESDLKRKETAMKALKRAAKFIRAEIAHRMSLKYTPQISFYEDMTKVRGDSIDEIFKKIEEEKQ